MTAKTCRDCRNVLEHNARGCPKCALNFEAENMVDQFIWRRLMPGVFLIALAVIALVFLLR